MQEIKYIACGCHGGEVTPEAFARMRVCRVCEGKGFRIDPTSISCNRCGGPMHEVHTPEDMSLYGAGPISSTGGYLSPCLTDLLTYEFFLCEKCLRDLFVTFKIPPTVHSCLHEEGLYDYQKDHQSWVDRVWINGGGRERKLPTGLCTESEGCQNPSTTIQIDEKKIHWANRFCAQHAYNTDFLSDKGIRHVPESEMSPLELFTLSSRYFEARYEKAILWEEHMDGVYEIHCHRIFELAMGLDKKLNVEGKTVYSMLAVREDRGGIYPKLHKYARGFLGFRSGDRCYEVAVMEAPSREAHREIISIGGIRCI